jgi:hypothetical protein
VVQSRHRQQNGTAPVRRAPRLSVVSTTERVAAMDAGQKTKTRSFRAPGMTGWLDPIRSASLASGTTTGTFGWRFRG